MSSIFGGGSQTSGREPPQYLPPPPPPPTPIVADYSKTGPNSASLIGGQGGTNVTGGKGLDTETSTTRKSLLGD